MVSTGEEPDSNLCLEAPEDIDANPTLRDTTMLLGSSDSARHVSAEQLRLELARLSTPTAKCGAHTVNFQPISKYPSEDRHLIEEWKLSNGTWKFIGIFDGHGAGHEAVDFVLDTLPSMIKASLESKVDASCALSSSVVTDILVDSITEIDDRITADLLSFFPDGPAQLSTLGDNEIKVTIRDPDTGFSYVEVMRARTGTTALVSLIDPRKFLYVASLGDCEALLAIRGSSAEWEVKTLSKRHNASNKEEADRVRAEHPGESGCIQQDRTLGLITLTRAIGDTMFKLPSIYTERVLSLATPPFHKNYNVDKLISRNITPPYLSNTAEVEHIDLTSLDPSANLILVLCSDGLCDLYSRRAPTRDISQEVQVWLTALGLECTDNLAFALLWDALGGDTNLEGAVKIVRGMPGRRVDDTTAIVLAL